MNGKITRILLPMLLLLLAGCGPIIGQMMKLSEGVQEFRVTKGSLNDLQPGLPVLVVGPFAKAPGAYYVCRGEDASQFTDAFGEAGLFPTEVHVVSRNEDPATTEKTLRSESAAQIRTSLGVAKTPRYLLFGTILHRQTIVAPTRGLIMAVGYRLEFYDLTTRRSTILEMAVKEPVEHCIPDLVKTLQQRLNRRP